MDMAVAEIIRRRLDERSEKGASMVEYGLLVALIAIISVVAVTAVGESTADAYESAAQALENVQLASPLGSYAQAINDLLSGQWTPAAQDFLSKIDASVAGSTATLTPKSGQFALEATGGGMVVSGSIDIDLGSGAITAGGTPVDLESVTFTKP